MVQREGRILRQGNENKEVFVYRYIAEGSFDAYSWQILETKQRFISQFLKGSSYQRTASDLEDNVLTYAEVKALALAEPLMKELAEKENEAKGLRIVISKEKENRNNLREKMKIITESLPRWKQRYEITIKNANYLKGVDNKQFEQGYKDISNLLLPRIVLKTEELSSDTEILGFMIVLPECQNEKKPYIYLERLGERYSLEVSMSERGNARRIINALKGFDKRVNEALKLYEMKKAQLGDISKQLEFEDKTYEEKLKFCEERILEIKNIIDLNRV